LVPNGLLGYQEHSLRPPLRYDFDLVRQLQKQNENHAGLKKWAEREMLWALGLCWPWWWIIEFRLMLL